MNDPHPLYDSQLDAVGAFVERAKVEPVAGTGVGLGPIALLIIAAAITAAVEYLVTHCLDKIFGKDLREPNAIQRARLRWAYVRPAVAKAIAAHPEAAGLSLAQRFEIENQVAAKLLGAARTVTDVEWATIKRDAKALAQKGKP